MFSSFSLYSRLMESFRFYSFTSFGTISHLGVLEILFLFLQISLDSKSLSLGSTLIRQDGPIDQAMSTGVAWHQRRYARYLTLWNFGPQIGFQPSSCTGITLLSKRTIRFILQILHPQVKPFQMI